MALGLAVVALDLYLFCTGLILLSALLISLILIPIAGNCLAIFIGLEGLNAMELNSLLLPKAFLQSPFYSLMISIPVCPRNVCNRASMYFGG